MLAFSAGAIFFDLSDIVVANGGSNDYMSYGQYSWLITINRG